jgi:hypothetical protein
MISAPGHAAFKRCRHDTRKPARRVPAEVPSVPSIAGRRHDVRENIRSTEPRTR